MRYKALMVDLDGTLAPYSQDELPRMPTKKVRDAVRQAVNVLYVGLATARSLTRAKPVIRNLNLNGYSMLLNGSQIISSETFKTVWKKQLNRSAVKELFKISRDYNIPLFFSDFHGEIAVTSFQQLKENPVGDLFFDGIQAEHVEAIEKEIGNITDISVHRLYSRREGLHEMAFNDIHATKLHAIAHIAKILKIKASEIIAVGDGYNDYPLLMASGLKIAMGNAVDELKAIADFIAPPVEEDGLVTVIEKFILQ